MFFQLLVAFSRQFVTYAGKLYKINMEKHKMNDGEFEMLAISEIYKAVSVFSVSSTGLVTQTPYLVQAWSLKHRM